MLNKDSRIPLYSQLVDMLVNKIENTMEENEQMPSEREICEIYNVSRTTVRQAISELERDGYIYKRQGKGTFVANKKYNQNLMGFYSFTEEMKKLDKKPSTKVLKFEIMTANNEIARKMKLGKEDLIYKFTRQRLADDEPMLIETTYVPYDIFPGITRELLNKMALYDIFNDKFNEDVAYAEEFFVPVLTNEDEANKINVEIGSPSLKIVRYAYSRNDKIIEYTISIARGDKFKYNIRLSKNK